MPRKSPYAITLHPGEQARLEKVARQYTAPYCLVVRAKIALLAAHGLDNNVIAERLDLPRQIVSKWRKRYFERGFDGLHDDPRSGRPRTFSPSGRRVRKGPGM